MVRAEMWLVLCTLLVASNGLTLFNAFGLKVALSDKLTATTGIDPVCVLQPGQTCPTMSGGYHGIGDTFL
jgi:hypothetical protein